MFGTPSSTFETTCTSLKTHLLYISTYPPPYPLHLYSTDYLWVFFQQWLDICNLFQEFPYILIAVFWGWVVGRNKSGVFRRGHLLRSATNEGQRGKGMISTLVGFEMKGNVWYNKASNSFRVEWNSMVDRHCLLLFSVCTNSDPFSEYKCSSFFVFGITPLVTPGIFPPIWHSVEETCLYIFVYICCIRFKWIFITPIPPAPCCFSDTREM